MSESLQLRVHGAAAEPTLIYLPGLHGDWTLLGPFRAALGGGARLVETTYPQRPEWTLDDYVAALETAFLERGIGRAWLLAESFSSQVAWQLLGRRETLGSAAGLEVTGLILVGGFVKHPWPWGVRAAHGASRAVPLWLLKPLCALYGRSASRRCCAAPEVAAEIEEFVRRRTLPADREAVTSRYRLIAGADFRPVARRARLPVYHLSGAIDPLVPWWNVVAWLKRDCPGFRASRIVRRAGHNVLLDAPGESVKQILEWIASASSC
jgi:pimeloyl-ACP methyl ester carboxylesterase